MNLDPRIGKLSGDRFYCFAQGYDRKETIGTLDEIEVALGLRVIKSKPMRQYIVTVTPVMITFGSHGASGEYTVNVSAISSSLAITKARQAHNDEEGRFGVRATYRAKLIDG